MALIAGAFDISLWKKTIAEVRGNPQNCSLSVLFKTQPFEHQWDRREESLGKKLRKEAKERSLGKKLIRRRWYCHPALNGNAGVETVLAVTTMTVHQIE